MNTRDTGAHGLEVIHHQPKGGDVRATPLLFVHGAYAGAWLWEKHYLPFFAGRGWHASALSLSGHGLSPGRERLDTFSLDDFTRDVRQVMRGFERPPVLIGHSMGGLIAQKCLDTERVPGLVLLTSAPPHGMLHSATDMMLRRPALAWELNRIQGGGAPPLEVVREALFHQPVNHATLMECMMRMQPESARAIWDMALFHWLRPVHRPHTLVIGAEHDKLIPVSQVHLTARHYGVKADIFPDLGHGLMLETDWLAPAEHIAAWLAKHGF